MKKISVKNLSLLGLVLMGASAVTAAVASDKSNTRRANNGTLRINSGISADGLAAVVSCSPRSGSAFSCTATDATLTSVGTPDESLTVINGLNYQTIGNTSQTNPNDGIDQNSVLQRV